MVVSGSHFQARRKSTGTGRYRKVLLIFEFANIKAPLHPKNNFSNSLIDGVLEKEKNQYFKFFYHQIDSKMKIIKNPFNV